VLSNPAIVHQIWRDIDPTGPIGKVGVVLEIFSDYLRSPTRDISTFLHLCLVLAGKKHEKRGASILEMLENTLCQEEQAKSTLLAELIAFMSEQIAPLENMHLETGDFNLVQALFTLFAKVLKQDPVQYLHLNNVYFRLAEMVQDHHLGFIFQRSLQRNGSGFKAGLYRFDMEIGSHPILSLLVRALHALMAVNFEYSRSVVYHLLDALTALYEQDDLMLKQELID